MARTGRHRTLPAYDFPGIYQILNLVNGKRYVGQAQNITNRIREHRRRRNGLPGGNQFSRLYRAIKKYGWDSFEFTVIERVDAIARLDERERFWIITLEVCDKAKGYNICSDPATTRGWRHTEESKEKMRRVAQAKVGEKNAFFGKRHSEEVKSRIGLANATRIRSDEERAKLKAARATSASGRAPRAVEQFNPRSGEVVRVWTSASEAARELGLSQGSLTGCCQGKRGRKTAGGWAWRYASP